MCVCVCVCVGVCVCGSIQPCGRRAGRFGKFWTYLHQQRKCLHLVFITVYCTHTDTHTHTLSLTAIISYLFSFGVEVLEVLVHITTCVPATNTDLKERSVYNWYYSVNGQSHCKTPIFCFTRSNTQEVHSALPKPPTQPPTLPALSLSLSLSLSLLLSPVSLSLSLALLCSILYTPLWHLTFVGPPVLLALRRGLSNRQINKQIELTPSQLGRVSQL